MPQRRVVAIHQPNFFPWLGYFNKIARADEFILMDNAQFPKTGGTWSNRVKILEHGQPAWTTMPILRAYHGTRPISQMEINNRTPWRRKLLTTLQTNYARAPYFDVVFSMLAELINYPSDSLTNYNVNAIRQLALAVGIDPAKFVLGSTLAVNGRATDLLIEMVKAVGGTSYLCGGGAGGYQEDEKFAAAGLGLLYQDFRHPHYPQWNTKEFIPGLSIVDALMNCGFEQTEVLISYSGVTG
jgi:hypothetical protein